MNNDDTTFDLSNLIFTDADTIDIGSLNTSVYTYGDLTADTITISDPGEYDLVVNRPGKPPLRVGQALDQIMERLAILEPDFDKMDRYPALREAYDNYKLIEAMLTGDEPNGQA